MPSVPWPSRPESALAAAEDPPARFAARELRLPARPSELTRAREYVDAAATAFGFDERDRFDFVFAANEAVTNAIRHGTPDAAGTISLRIAADGDRLLLDVWDRGPFVTPAANGEVMPDHGRGLGLMALLMDEFEVRAEPDGTTVRLAKLLVADGAADDGHG
jgi:anti-sigma regulatory factor (Ser/Thr protein kinase)